MRLIFLYLCTPANKLPWRADWPHSTGSLIWQYNDCWPGTTWSMVDYFGRWKALQYAARRFYAPLLVTGVAQPATGHAKVSVASDQLQPAHGTFSWSLTDLTGAELAQGSSVVDVPAGTSSVDVADLDLHEALAGIGQDHALLWLKLTVADRTASENLVTFVRPKDLALLDPRIDANVTPDGAGYNVTLTAQHPALFAWLELENIDARWPDNFVPLPMSQPVSFHLTSSTPLTLEQVKSGVAGAQFVRYLRSEYAPRATGRSLGRPG